MLVSRLLLLQLLLVSVTLLVAAKEDGPSADPASVALSLADDGSAAPLTQCDVYRLAVLAEIPAASIPAMVCTAKWESSWKPDIANKNKDGSTDRGLWQINNRYWCLDPTFPGKANGCGLNCSSMLLPLPNAVCAARILHQQGITAWYGYKAHKAECDSYVIDRNCTGPQPGPSKGPAPLPPAPPVPPPTTPSSSVPVGPPTSSVPAPSGSTTTGGHSTATNPTTQPPTTTTTGGPPAPPTTTTTGGGTTTTGGGTTTGPPAPPPTTPPPPPFLTSTDVKSSSSEYADSSDREGAAPAHLKDRRGGSGRRRKTRL